MQVRKALKILICLTVLTAGLLFVQTVFAQDIAGINAVGEEIALQGGDPRMIAARIVRAALGFLGIIALGIVLYGGFVWMTSAGNEEKIAKAKKILTNGIIGLVIISMAFGITQYVINTLLGITPPGGGVPTGPPVIGRYSGALGNSIIESHYPPRGGRDIARNTKIIVTFKEPMLLSTLINNYNDDDDTVVKNDNGTPGDPTDDWMEVNSENVRIYPSLEGETSGTILNYLEPEEVRVEFTSDRQTFTFKPIELLGGPSEEVDYTVALKGANPPDSSGLKKIDEQGAVRDAFAGAFRDGYAWDFRVSTFIDTTPPKITDIVPLATFCPPGGCPRNILIQINFNEAMDPTTVSGDAPPFNKIEVMNGSTRVEGAWAIGNQYRTVEFTTNDSCGTNSCGGEIFCLPPSSDITVTVKAATLSESPPEARWEYDGATDVVGNSLDGNRNDTAEGPTMDNYTWTFRTSAAIDSTPPEITLVEPEPGESDVTPLNRLIKIRFDGLMSVTSFNTDNIILDDNQRLVEKASDEGNACGVWFTLESELLDSGTPTPKHRAIISHGDFIESVDAATPFPRCSDDRPVDRPLVFYYPRVTHHVEDIYQNCFYPPEASSGVGGGTSCTPTTGGTGCVWGFE